MNEQEIQQKLLQNVPRPEEDAPVAAPPPTLTDEQSSVVDQNVSELELFKLGSQLGVDNPQGKSVEYLQFIYKNLHQPGDSYDDVSEKVNQHLLMLGLYFQPDRMLKLYMWTKLNTERILINREMEGIANGS